jgi:hypothetical protein
MAEPATFADIVAMRPQHAAVMEAARALVRRVHPDAVETARPGWRNVCWGFGPGMKDSDYAYVQPFDHHVNLGFMHGAALPDPDGRLRGTGKGMRHMQVKSAPELNDPAVETLIRAARDERCRALNL